jgi:hypothetical protein
VTGADADGGGGSDGAAAADCSIIAKPIAQVAIVLGRAARVRARVGFIRPASDCLSVASTASGTGWARLPAVLGVTEARWRRVASRRVST